MTRIEPNKIIIEIPVIEGIDPHFAKEQLTLSLVSLLLHAQSKEGVRKASYFWMGEMVENLIQSTH